MDEISRSGTAGRTPSTAARTLGVAVAGAIMLLFGTPLNVLWMDAPGSWWLVYTLWLVAIGLILLAARRGR
jgi:Flp pilus assembly protein TadB